MSQNCAIIILARECRTAVSVIGWSDRFEATEMSHASHARRIDDFCYSLVTVPELYRRIFDFLASNECFIT